MLSTRGRRRVNGLYLPIRSQITVTDLAILGDVGRFRRTSKTSNIVSVSVRAPFFSSYYLRRLLFLHTMWLLHFYKYILLLCVFRTRCCASSIPELSWRQFRWVRWRRLFKTAEIFISTVNIWPPPVVLHLSIVKFWGGGLFNVLTYLFNSNFTYFL